MIEVGANVLDKASPALRAVIAGLSGEEASEISEASGIAARNAAIQYHRSFDQAGGWKGPRYLGPSRSDGSSFGAEVAAGWNLESFDRHGATIANDARHLRFKASGGVIRPKRARYLTIPLIREARGMYASVYQQNTGKRLFRPKGRDVLMEKGEDGTARSVYALVKSVTMRPWPGALPDSQTISDAYVEQYRESLADLIDRS